MLDNLPQEPAHPKFHFVFSWLLRLNGIWLGWVILVDVWTRIFVPPNPQTYYSYSTCFLVQPYDWLLHFGKSSLSCWPKENIATLPLPDNALVAELVLSGLLVAAGPLVRYADLLLHYSYYKYTRLQREEEERRVAKNRHQEQERQLRERREKQAIAEREEKYQREKEAVADTEKAQWQADRQVALSASNLILGTAYQREWNSSAAVWQTEAVKPEKLLYLPLEQLTQHLLLVAPTQSGKTTLIRPIVGGCRVLNAALILFDPKGTDHLPTDFELNFSMRPAEASNSIRLCLIDPGLPPIEAAQKLAESLIASAAMTYYSNVARLLLTAYLVGHKAAFGSYPELDEVLLYLDYRDKRLQLGSSLKELAYGNSGLSSPATKALAADAITLLRQADNLTGGRKEPVSELVLALTPLATGRFKDYVTTNEAFGYSVQALIGARQRVRIAFTSDQGEIGQAIARALITQYTDYCLSDRVDKSFIKLLVVDEAHNYVCNSLLRGVSQLAGNKAGYVLIFQGLPQLSDPQLRAVVFDNCSTKITLANLGNQDAEEFSRFYGEQARKVAVSQSRYNAETQVSYVTRRNWTATELRAIPPYHAVVRFKNKHEAALVRLLTPHERAELQAQREAIPQASVSRELLELAAQRLAAYSLVRVRPPDSAALGLVVPNGQPANSASKTEEANLDLAEDNTLL